MFTFNDVRLRPIEPGDIERMYAWHLDAELEILSSWGPRRSRAAFEKRWTRIIEEPDEKFILFAIEAAGDLVGRIELAEIDREHRRAVTGLFVGKREARGRGVGSTALRIMLDYAFTVENLEKICGHVFGFNARSQRLMTRVGFTLEGVLREHDVHNGARRDAHAYGILKREFYEKYDTIFAIPKA